jgi:RNA polymerase sigma-70 factor, ECF subfamily
MSLQDGQIADLLAAGRQAWPTIGVDAAAFARFVRERLPGSAELVLTFACLSGDTQALSELDRRYLARVPQWVARVDASPDFGGEVRQMLAEKLLVGSDGRPRLADFTGKGSLEGWLRVAALRTALNLRRGQALVMSAEQIDARRALAASDHELKLIATQHREHFRDAFRDAFAALTPRARHVVRLHFVDGLTLQKIANMHQVNVSTVWRWIGTAHADLARRIKEQLRQRAGLSESQVDQLVHTVQQQLDVSLTGLLRSAQP